MATLSLHDVSKIFAGKNDQPRSAVEGFSLDVNDREFVVIAGPPCSGKSTILRIISGLDEVSTGDISIDAKRVNDLPPKDREVSIVFQDYALLPHLNVAENLAFGVKLRRFSKAEIKKRVEEAARILGLEQYLDLKPKVLSGPEQQRVAIGRAMVRQPKVFLFDEPLANLEAAERVAMRAEMKQLHQRLQATMIYVTRDPEEAMALGDRIVVLRDGVAQQIGTPQKLYSEPANLFVAAFLGHPPMNFVTGKLKEAGDALVFKEAGEGVIEWKFSDRPEMRAFAGKEVVLGIRPEDIEFVTDDKRLPSRFRALVDVVEPLGAEMKIHIQTGAHAMISRSRTVVDQSDMGHRAQFEIKKAHWFDPVTSDRIA